ncbi:MAG: FliI/YscN family ATPase [Deltaproteobacteria bacterium]|nr:FliI/YscN family ATPase [Deltaproteobacteria bacterium]
MHELISLDRYRERLDDLETVKLSGYVRKIAGTVIEATGPKSAVGSTCLVFPRDEEGRELTPLMAEVVGFDERGTMLMPLEDARGVLPGSRVERQRTRPYVRVGEDMLGRVLTGLGEPLDGLPAPVGAESRALYGRVGNPVRRRRIAEVLDTGVAAINATLTLGLGQKVGIFAGSGVGKSVLLGMIARHTAADVNVIALIGERGREVREFIERDLGEEGLARSVIVAATSDRSPLQRLRAAYLATTVAEYFRDRGKRVLLMMDSLTRFAMARREIGLAVGEPPTSKGYTPSVFALMPALLERVGNAEGEGGITGLYTVLVEGDDMNDPVADAARSILDGHIVLSRRLAARNHYPAIDILESSSRCMPDIVAPDHRALAGHVRETLAAYAEAEDLVNIGAYVAGSNPRIDQALAVIDDVTGLLRQKVDERVPVGHAVAGMARAFQKQTAGRPREAAR